MVNPTTKVDHNVANNTNLINDLLYIASSDHPGMLLTNTSFYGSNFLGWSRNVNMALGAKLKLGFIDGSCVKPAVNDVNLHMWIRFDYMVTCWILNSMVTELSDAFLYAQSACEIWKEIVGRYGQSNGPMIYQLERELSKITQGSLSIASFFNKLKRCWDELKNLNGLPVCNCDKMLECTCSVYEKFLERDSYLKLIQFLMKLNDEYESVKRQSLDMDPLPNVNNAYYIVQQIEKQKQVASHSFIPFAFFANNDQRSSNNDNVKKDFKQSINDSRYEQNKVCTGCSQEGHAYEQCFETIGYPNWYKGKNGKKGAKIAAQVHFGLKDEMSGDSPFDTGCENEIRLNCFGNVDQKLVLAVCQEKMKMFKGKGPMEESNSGRN